jgi:hypothetical protein
MNTEDIIMKRVRRIYILRQYVNRTTLKLYAGGILMGALMGMVSVSNILANMPSLMAPGRFIDFVVRAVVDTEFAVQILFVGFLTATVLTLYDIAKNMLQNKVIFAQI